MCGKIKREAGDLDEGSGITMKAFWVAMVPLVCVVLLLIGGKHYLQGRTQISHPESEIGTKYVDPVFGLTQLGILGQVKSLAAKAEMVTIQQAIVSFNLREDRMPNDLAELVESNDLKRAALKDADGRKYRIRADEEGQVFIVSPGPDGIAGTEDDVRYQVEGIQAAKPAAPTVTPTVPWSSLYPTPTPKRLFGATRNVEK